MIKGMILSLEGPLDGNGNKTRARCCPLNKEELVTRPLTLPFYLRGSFGQLQKGTVVVYEVFDDETGIVIERMDGEWIGQNVPGTVHVEKDVVVDGDVRVAGDITAGPNRISSSKHTHGGVEPGGGSTGRPK